MNDAGSRKMDGVPGTPRTGLSKSRVLSGLQCQRRLWLETYRRDLIVIDAQQQQVFDAGNALGELARVLLGPGELIGHVDNIDAAIAETSKRLAGRRTTLFEPAFRHDGVLVRADVLKPVARGYDLIEVKGSTSVKDQYISDCAVQAWVIKNAGLPLKRIHLAHIDNTFVYPGDGDYRGLLRVEDITDAVRKLMPEVAGWVASLKKMLAGTEPDIKTGKQCTNPYPCPFFAHCRAQEPAPPEYPVEILGKKGRLVSDLHAEGYVDVREVPEQRLEKPMHRRIRKASITGKAFVDAEASRLLAKLAYPRYYIDFETIAFGIPRWKGTRPFQQVPFQWSCHVQHADGALEHQNFLDLSGDNPAEQFVKSLLAVTGSRSPILVYNQAFEATRLRELGEMFPAHAAALGAIAARMVDLLPIAREHYYHPAMMGSWSIKAVLPTIAPELSYEHLDDVADGSAAQQAYLEAIDPETPAERHAQIEQALLRYCENDTVAMIKVVQAFTAT